MASRATPLGPPRQTGSEQAYIRALAIWMHEFYERVVVDGYLSSAADTEEAINAAVQAAFDELQANIDAVLPTPYTAGDLLYALTANELGRLAAAAIGQVLLAGGAGTPPSWGKVGLTTHVSGTLAPGNGGTGLTGGTSGGLLGFTGASTIASSGALTANAIVLGGGAGVLPSTPLGLGTSTQFLKGNASGPPSWGGVNLASDVTGTLPVANGGATSGTYTPTLTNALNAAASTAYKCQWMRAGNTVTVSGRVDIDPTAAGSVQVGISLPVASNLAAANDCAGCAFSPSVAGQGAAVMGDAANNRAQMEWIASDTANRAMYFTFTYEVL